MVFFFLVLIYNYFGDIMKKKVYIWAFIFFLIDLISKVLISHISIKMPYQIIKNFFYLDLTYNNGAAFSLLPGATYAFIIIGVIVLIYIDKNLINEVNNYFIISLIIGGIVGNILDRVIYGKVIDFISFQFGSYYFPIFNLADSFICIGVFLLLIEYIRSDSNGNKSRNK